MVDNGPVVFVGFQGLDLRFRQEVFSELLGLFFFAKEGTKRFWNRFLISLSFYFSLKLLGSFFAIYSGLEEILNLS